MERVPPLQRGDSFPSFREAKMKKRKPMHPVKGKHARQKNARGSMRSTSWTDPTLPLHKISKRGKIKSNSREGQKKSCWWFG
jgi:hypothetical protein